MENASKVLIIAAAVLMSILIIGLVVFLYNKSAENTEIALEGVSKATIKTHNDKFMKYNGRRNNIEVEKLLNAVIQANATAKEKDEGFRVPAVIFEDKIIKKNMETKKFKLDEGNKLNEILRNIARIGMYDVFISLDARHAIVDKIEITRVE